MKTDVNIDLLGVKGNPILKLDSVYTHGKMLEMAFDEGVLNNEKSQELLVKKLFQPRLTLTG